MPKKSNEAEAPQPLGGAEQAAPPLTTDEEADKQAATSGYLFDIQLSYFTQFTKDELLAQGYSKEDVARAARVLKYANMAIPKEPIPRVVAEKAEEEEYSG